MAYTVHYREHSTHYLYRTTRVLNIHARSTLGLLYIGLPYIALTINNIIKTAECRVY